MLTINGIEDLKGRVGQELGVSDWHEVSQAEIDAFAEATDDHQFIHVDPERAKQTPFGSTIAHGLYTLSLGPKFSYEMFSVDNVAFGINYGYEKIRFPAPVPVDSKVRMRAELLSVDDIPGGAQFKVKQTYEIEGAEKPACVAEALARVYEG
jgi:acyl dehydratase